MPHRRRQRMAGNGKRRSRVPAGAIIACLWIAGSAAAMRYAEFRIAGLMRNAAFEVCDYVNHRLGDFPDCWRSLLKAADAIDAPLADVAIVSLMPVLLGWFVVGIGPMLRRRERASRR